MPGLPLVVPGSGQAYVSLIERTRSAAMPRLEPADLVREYEKTRARYTEFASMLGTLTTPLIEAAGIKVHSIQCRTKSVESVRLKLSRVDKQYSSLTDVTDLVGVRIISYFEGDISKISDLIEQEFAVDT